LLMRLKSMESSMYFLHPVWGKGYLAFNSWRHVLCRVDVYWFFCWWLVVLRRHFPFIDITDGL
jgi:hypothetical protein